MPRFDGRALNQLRPVKITRHFQRGVDGSVLIQVGHTHVICSATVEEKVPPFLKGKGQGWITAEYGMLPRSSPQRIDREAARGKVQGRTMEIQRLIGRSLRAVLDPVALGERQILIDCDVIQADGGTRCASITGAYVALVDALQPLIKSGALAALPLKGSVAAISIGLVGGEICLDLPYEEDSTADVDMNVVATGSGQLIEVGSTAEKGVFDRAQLNQMLDLALQGIADLSLAQKAALAS